MSLSWQPTAARRLVTVTTAILALALLDAGPWRLGKKFGVLDARPNRYGHSDREERHMLPSVSSGPLYPAWSPDGRWMAFSMRGDIWKGAGRRRRGGGDHVRSRLSLRAGVESGRHAHRASPITRHQAATLRLASSAPTAGRFRPFRRMRAWTSSPRGAVTARVCSSSARARAVSGSSGTTSRQRLTRQ